MKYIPHFCSCYNSNFRCKIFQFQVLKQVSIKLRVSIVIWEPWSNVCARILSACEHLDEYDDVYQCLNPLKIYIEFRYWINVRWHKIDTILYMTFSCSFSWMKLVFWFKFNWSLFLRIQLIISQQSRVQFMTCHYKTTNHCLNQW